MALTGAFGHWRFRRIKFSAPVYSHHDYHRRQCNESGDADDHYHQKCLAHYFSRRTPLNFLAAFFFAAGFLTAMNSPKLLLRLVHAVTPPSRALS
jgi:hypothetical protein